MDFFDRLLQQQRYILDLSKTLGTEAGIGSRLRTLDRLEQEFELHCFLQESCIYPVLDRYEDSKSRAAVLWDTHYQIRGELRQLREEARREGAWSIELAAVIEALESHFDDENRHVLGDLRRLVSEEALMELKNQIEVAERQKRQKLAA